MEKTLLELDMEYAEILAKNLVAFARLHGVVVEITLKPTYPLRMGGYEPQISIRPARNMAE